jgi:thiamine pyrophosphate-dependent acetolactate synthase large subunit-like protein
MKVSDAIADILRREGVEWIIGYPVNHILERGAAAGIRPIVVRQERTGLHMADAVSRVTSGDQLGVFCMQYGPGLRRVGAYPGDAGRLPAPARLGGAQLQCQRRHARRHQIGGAGDVGPGIVRDHAACLHAAALRTRGAGADRGAQRRLGGGSRPADYAPPRRLREGPDPDVIREAAGLLFAAKRPVIYAGQGVHWAKAWYELKRLAELLAIPVCTSLQGKSAFPETHPLALGSGGLAIPATVHHFLRETDLIFGIGCSFTQTNFGVAMPKGKAIVHATLDPMDVNKDVPCALAVLGDAQLTLAAIIEEIERRHGTSRRDAAPVALEIAEVREPWLAKWLPKLTHDGAPFSPYRVLWDLQQTVDVANTIITHDAGSPRDQLSPFWRPVTPLSYLGWGKTTQLGYGLGLAMGAKLAKPDKLCINVWGDAAIGFTGMDFETAVRERIPILSILLNNFSMAIELKVMPVATEKYRSTDISGDYAAFARAMGGYGERVERLAEIVPAIRRGIAATERGQPALLEFITTKEVEVSRF